MANSARIAHGVARALTRLFVAAVRVLGLIAAVKQLLVVPHPDSVELVFSGFLLAGAQVSEGLILGFIDRLMGPHGTAEHVEADRAREP